MKKLSAVILGLLGIWLFVSPPHVQALCSVSAAAPTFTDGSTMQAESCDTSGYQRVTLGGGTSAGGLGTATAAAPSLAEGAAASFSFDLAGNARVTLGTLLSGEDQTNNLMMTSGGAVRFTQILGTGLVPSTATDATSAVSLLPVGKKTLMGVVTCTGTCVQTQKIYGTWQSSTSYGEELCTLNLNASTTAHASCIIDTAWAYYFVVTTNTSGTTPLSGVFAMY